MDYLNPEQERALRAVARLAGTPANRAAVEGAVEADCLFGLVDSGHVGFECSGNRGVYDRVVLLTAGRNYFAMKRRDRFRRWAPVLASACIGAAGTLLGVATTLLLA